MTKNYITTYPKLKKKSKLEVKSITLLTASDHANLEAHAGFFRLIMKGIFDPYVLRPFDKKLIS